MKRERESPQTRGTILLQAAVVRIELLDEPLNRRAQRMGAGLVIEFNRHRDQHAASAGQFDVQLVQIFRRDRRGGGDGADGGLAKFCLNVPDDGNDAFAGAEVAKQELAARCFRQCEQRARVDRADVIQVLRPGRKAQEVRGIGRDLDADELIEREFSDAVFHRGSDILLRAMASLTCPIAAHYRDQRKDTRSESTFWNDGEVGAVACGVTA